MSLTKLSKVEESIALYLSAAEKFNELVHRKQPVSSQITRDVACYAMMVFYAYNLPCNRTSDGKPRIAIPPALAQDVTRNIQMILEVHIPTWMLHLEAGSTFGTSENAPGNRPCGCVQEALRCRCHI